MPLREAGTSSKAASAARAPSRPHGQLAAAPAAPAIRRKSRRVRRGSHKSGISAVVPRTWRDARQGRAGQVGNAGWRNAANAGCPNGNTHRRLPPSCRLPLAIDPGMPMAEPMSGTRSDTKATGSESALFSEPESGWRRRGPAAGPPLDASGMTSWCSRGSRGDQRCETSTRWTAREIATPRGNDVPPDDAHAAGGRDVSALQLVEPPVAGCAMSSAKHLEAHEKARFPRIFALDMWS